MAYEYSSRIGYSSTGTDGRLSLTALVNYFQDCSTFHSQDCGLGLEHLAQKNRVWMILSWQIDILRYPVLCDRVRVQTVPYDFKGFYGCRNFAMLDEAGEYLVKANSVWVFINTETGRPCRVDPEQIAGYGMGGERLEMEYLSRKIPVPEGGIRQESFPVGRHHIDTNGHVNNGQYIGMAEEYLPEGAHVSRLRVEYRRQARLHDRIMPVVSADGERMTVSLCDLQGKPYAVVEFNYGTDGSR